MRRTTNLVSFANAVPEEKYAWRPHIASAEYRVRVKPPAGPLSVPDADLNKTVKLLNATHMHEHLGQAIAYARTNNVIPRWSIGKSE